MKVKKISALVILTVLVLLFSGSCTRGRGADAVSGATELEGPPSHPILKSIMPGAMADDVVKIAVLVNQKESDNSRMFIQGCVTEGRALGFTVDTFISGGDEKQCRKYAEGIARADYDGLVFAYGDEGFSYDILKPVADREISIVTFEALPYRDGKSIKGLITTFQNDYNLARLSLDTLISHSRIPARVIRIASSQGTISLDRRDWEFDMFTLDGKIKEMAVIRLDNTDNPYSAAREGVTAILSRFPPGTVDALWVPWDEFSSGCADALSSAGRTDIKMVSIGISSEDINLMYRHSDFWFANAAVDLKLAGTVNMRIMAAKLAGETLEETFSFNPQLIQSSDLTPAVNISNISLIIPNWDSGQGLFDNYQWMKDLKAVEGRYLRISSPVAASSEAAQ